MRIHWQNLKYLLRHKWYVFKAGLKLGVPLHQLVLHDYSKFFPVEWFGYARKFYGTYLPLEEWKRVFPGDSRLYYGVHVRTQEEVDEAFDRAWLHHQKWNAHHWQYWVMIKDSGESIALEMPERFAREMVADWSGASMAIRGYDDTLNWYAKNRKKMILHASTRSLVERLLGYVPCAEIS